MLDQFKNHSKEGYNDFPENSGVIIYSEDFLDRERFISALGRFLKIRMDDYMSGAVVISVLNGCLNKLSIDYDGISDPVVVSKLGSLIELFIFFAEGFRRSSVSGSNISHVLFALTEQGFSVEFFNKEWANKFRISDNPEYNPFNVKLNNYFFDKDIEVLIVDKDLSNVNNITAMFGLFSKRLLSDYVFGSIFNSFFTFTADENVEVFEYYQDRRDVMSENFKIENDYEYNFFSYDIRYDKEVLSYTDKIVGLFNFIQKLSDRFIANKQFALKMKVSDNDFSYHFMENKDE